MPATITHNRYQPDPYDTKGFYVHRNGPGSFTSYVDGWVQYPDCQRTYSAAARTLFPYHSHGYPLAYYPETGDGELIGDVLCADCAATEWIANPAQRYHVEIEEETLEHDVICDQCSAIIAPQQCRLCFDSIHEPPFDDRESILPVFVSDEGYAMHGHCIAKAVVDGEYRKTGKQTYDQVSCIGRFHLPSVTAQGAR